MDEPSDFTVPDQSGRTALVTGANSGLGFRTTERLAAAGAAVIMACRDPRKADAARDRLEAEVPGARLELLALDLASLESVRDAADRVRRDHDRLDLLINNAGVMAIPRSQTAEGFEMQLGTNHLGHFALTGRLIDVVLATKGSRVVTVSSTAHRAGQIRFDDLQGRQRYGKWSAYGQSKLANLLFAYELQRRLTAAGSDTLSLAAHPGWAATHLQTTGRGLDRGLMHGLTKLANRAIAQDDAMGALPTLMAATSPDAAPGDYYGPSGWFEVRGLPEPVDSTKRSRDRATARRTWEVSEDLTGVRYDALATVR